MSANSSVCKPRTYALHAACCIIPPSEKCQQIQEIRAKHDPGFYRWMPHINLLFPFIDPLDFASSKVILESKLKDLKPFKIRFTRMKYFEQSKKATLWLEPHVVEHDSLTDIKNKEELICNSASVHSPTGDDEKKSATNMSNIAHDVVSSSSQTHANNVQKNIQNTEQNSLLQLQSIIQETFPQLKKINKKNETGTFVPHLTLGCFPKKQVEKIKNSFESEWKEFEFEVREIYFISRDGKDTPMLIRHAVPFGNKTK